MIVSVCNVMKAFELIVPFLVVQAMSQVPELSSTLHSTSYGVHVAYAGETVSFTCVVRGSNSMAWTSDQYIGTGGQQLEFLAAEPPGSMATAIGNSRTMATLVNTTGSEFIVSRLQITIESNIPTASVQCRNINANTTASIRFLLAGTTSVICDRPSACPGETVTCACATGNSNTLTWTANGNRLTFMSTDPPLTRRNVTGSTTFAVLTDNSDRNGIRVIMSNLTFIASMTGVLVCETVDPLSSSPIIIPVSETCPDPFVQVTTSARIDAAVDSTGPIIAAVVVPLVIVVASIIIVIGVILVCLRRTKDKVNKKNGGLRTELEREKTKVKRIAEEKENLKKDLDAEARDKRKLERDLQTEKASVEQLTKDKGGLEKKVEKLQGEKKKLDDEVAELKKKLKEKTGLFSGLTSRLTNRKEDVTPGQAYKNQLPKSEDDKAKGQRPSLGSQGSEPAAGLNEVPKIATLDGKARPSGSLAHHAAESMTTENANNSAPTFAAGGEQPGSLGPHINNVTNREPPQRRSQAESKPTENAGSCAPTVATVTGQPGSLARTPRPQPPINNTTNRGQPQPGVGKITGPSGSQAESKPTENASDRASNFATGTGQRGLQRPPGLQPGHATNYATNHGQPQLWSDSSSAAGK